MRLSSQATSSPSVRTGSVASDAESVEPRRYQIGCSVFGQFLNVAVEIDIEPGYSLKIDRKVQMGLAKRRRSTRRSRVRRHLRPLVAIAVRLRLF